jgi:hypothetical protein
MIKLPLTFVMNQTFEVWTEEDIEAGETNNRGFDFEKTDFSLAALRDHIEKEEFTHASETPVTNSQVWLTVYQQPDPANGESLNNSLHCVYIKDADGMPIDEVSEGKIWRNLVRQVVGEKNLEAQEDLSL